ncbi:Lumazine-binding protein [Pleurocapsa sp. CCALA 161]|uniref:Lumazine-binding protein n=1 Tax=Pleurocapsa sp. CCALA 161 TaxID=2107688 RepID=UPI000D052C01|nr:Lumazine-binding protein [Pleurocapsa sp. CCALA 161]PSB06631.1 Lumazine-binding protein [Pleurocapsa sp. CCALA 161]
MFIGVVKDTGIVEQTEPELIIKVDSDSSVEIEIESHLAVNGRVLKVSSIDDNNQVSRLKFFNSNLNQSKSYLPPEKVNLERAVRLGEEIPGAFFYGIPTGLVELVSQELLSDGNVIMKVSFEDDLVNYLSVLDVVCLDGVLVQIIDIDNYLLSFNVYPNTLKITNLGEKKSGNKLSIELDPLTIKVAKIFQKQLF